MLTAAPIAIHLSEALGASVDPKGVGVRADGTAVVAANLLPPEGETLPTIVSIGIDGSLNADPAEAGVSMEGISANGAWFTGNKFASQGFTAIRGETDQPASYEDIGADAPTSNNTSSGLAVSNTGTVVGLSFRSYDPFRWDETNGYQILPNGSSIGIAHAISSDGALVVGASGGAAFWNASNSLSVLPNQNGGAIAVSISASGEYIGGHARDNSGSSTGDVASLWRDRDGIIEANATGDDYVQVIPTYSDGTPVQGEITAVTDNGYAFVETLDELLVYHESMPGVVDLESWLQDEHAIGLPAQVVEASGAIFDSTNGTLHLLAKGRISGEPAPAVYLAVASLAEPGMPRRVDASLAFQTIAGLGVRGDGTLVVAGQGSGGEGRVGTIGAHDSSLVSEAVGSLTGGGVQLHSVSPNGEWFAGAELGSTATLGLTGATGDSELVQTVGSLSPNSNRSTIAYDVSDSRWAAGASDGLRDPFRWTPSEGITALPHRGTAAVHGTSADGRILVGNDRVAGQPSQAVLWNLQRTQSLLPNLHAVGIVNDISPSGRFVGGSATFTDASLGSIEQASLWILNGDISPATNAGNYGQVLVTEASGEPFQGEVVAVTDLGFAFIESAEGIFVWRAADFVEPIRLDDWLGNEFQVTIPTPLTDFGQAIYDSHREQLHLALNGSAEIVSLPVPRVVGANVRFNGIDSTRRLAVFNEGSEPIRLATSATIVGLVGGRLSSAQVKLDDIVDSVAEHLSATTIEGLQAVYDESFGVLTISGNASVPAYQSVLRSLTYQHTGSPLEAGKRTIEVTLYDGESHSPTASMDLWIYDDEPVWQNSTQPEDTDGNGMVTLTDALVIMAELRNGGTRWLNPEGPGAAAERVDVDGNNFLSLSDPLLVVSMLRQQPGEGEMIPERVVTRHTIQKLEADVEADCESIDHDTALLAVLAEYR